MFCLNLKTKIVHLQFVMHIVSCDMLPFFEEITAREAPAVVLLLIYIEKVHKKKKLYKDTTQRAPKEKTETTI
jgi:hypothetical protein